MSRKFDPITVTPLGGRTLIRAPAREDLRQSHDFKVGERVRMKAEHLAPGVDQARWTGTVARVPDGPVVQLAGRTIGNEMSVKLDGGGTAVAEVEKWERVP